MTGKIVTLAQLHEAIRALRGSLSYGTCPHAVWDTFNEEVLGSCLLFENSTIEEHELLRKVITAILQHVLPSREVVFDIHRFRDSEFWHGPLGISDTEVGWFFFDDSIGEGLLFLGLSDGQQLIQLSRVRSSPRATLPN